MKQPFQTPSFAARCANFKAAQSNLEKVHNGRLHQLKTSAIKQHHVYEAKVGQETIVGIRIQLYLKVNPTVD